MYGSVGVVNAFWAQFLKKQRRDLLGRGWGCQGRRALAFILTLDIPILTFTIGMGTKIGVLF
jgi:hypothetical protein